MKDKKVYLILENNMIFEGKRFGSDKESLGELVFTTKMGGYIETLTDPSYYGQICVQTFPLIGNYGIIEEDFDSPICQMKGYVVREYCDFPSNFRSDYTLDTYLKNQDIPGVYDIDTRHLTSVIREIGTMNAKISNNPPSQELMETIKNYKITQSVETLSCKKIEDYPVRIPKHNVLLIDNGCKNDIIKALNKKFCNITCLPYDAHEEEILDYNPDGIILSNGPGDPKDNLHAIKLIKSILGKQPILGIGLGHQLMALALGQDTVKLKYGHRGANQPVIEKSTNNVYITTQNHGYTVVGENKYISFINANDHTCEGMDYPKLMAFSSQFNPETSSGLKSAGFLYDKFINMMEVYKNAKR